MDLAEVTKMYDFTGRSIVITGGAGVLGGEVACALVGCGAKVAILDRDPALADRLMKRFETSIGEAIVVYADVLNRASLLKAEQAVIEAFGRIDGLINSAGGNKPDATTGDRSFFDVP